MKLLLIPAIALLTVSCASDGLTTAERTEKALRALDALYHATK